MPRVKLETLEQIGNEINKIVEEDGLTVMDAVLKYCESTEVEIEVIGDIVKQHPALRSSIEVEARKLNFLPRANAEIEF